MKVYHKSSEIENILVDGLEKEVREKVKTEAKEREKKYKEIKDEMKELDAIKKVSFNLRPSNPCNKRMWRKIDKKLKQLAVSRYSVTYEFEENIKPSRGSEIYAMIIMALCGYGEGEIFGEKGGKPMPAIEIPKGIPLKAMEEEPILSVEKSETDTPGEILEEIQRGKGHLAYIDIMNRFKK